MMEYWNNGREYGEHSGGPRSVVADVRCGRDGARPSKYIIPTFLYSIIPLKFYARTRLYE
jgi:hypothetical protein